MSAVGLVKGEQSCQSRLSFCQLVVALAQLRGLVESVRLRPFLVTVLQGATDVSALPTAPCRVERACVQQSSWSPLVDRHGLALLPLRVTPTLQLLTHVLLLCWLPLLGREPAAQVAS